MAHVSGGYLRHFCRADGATSAPLHDARRPPISPIFAAAHESVTVKVLGRLHDYPMDERRRQASEKRQGTKSREVSTRECNGLWGISLEAHGSDSRVWEKELTGHGTRGCWEGGKEGRSMTQREAEFVSG